MKFSKSFLRFNWITLILIYLVVIAGSFVRITGSGMGCPDWPKCFGQWVPPTEVSQLPENYQAKYLENRVKKVDKFSKLLNAIGLNTTANRLQNDPNVVLEEPFNAQKTWTEYVNRLFGFLAGNFMLIAFFWILLKYRKRKLILLSGVNLILMGFQAWFGSIVVASNLVPWTITVHMFLALLIIALQIYLIYLIDPTRNAELPIKKNLKWLLIFVFAITIYQIFLGTQVREAIDELTKRGIGQSDWENQLGMKYYIHRSFSWLVLIVLTYVAFYNEKNEKLKIIRWTYIVLFLGLLSGVILSNFNVSGLFRTAHLVFASILFGILSLVLFRLKEKKPF